MFEAEAEAEAAEAEAPAESLLHVVLRSSSPAESWETQVLRESEQGHLRWVTGGDAAQAVRELAETPAVKAVLLGPVLFRAGIPGLVEFEFLGNTFGPGGLLEPQDATRVAAEIARLREEQRTARAQARARQAAQHAQSLRDDQRRPRRGTPRHFESANWA